MLRSRRRPKGVIASFGLPLLILLSMPTGIGNQDITSLMARDPSVAARWREHLIASPFGTIHAAMFNFPRPLGMAMPDPAGFRVVSLDPNDPDVTGSIGGPASSDSEETAPADLVFPTVNRTLKGDILVPRARREGAQAAAAQAAAVRPPADTRRQGLDTSALVSESEEGAEDSGPPVLMQSSPTITTARLFFGSDTLGTGPNLIEPWKPGEQPVLLVPANLDPDVKMSALSAAPGRTDGKPKAQIATSGETVAGKGEVTGEGHRPQSPAERLGLTGKGRSKAETCLANAIYFEARGEPERGQKAVAQVVVNRVFSGYYPDDVCGVVYQNAHHHLACQFTFACDGSKDRNPEPDMWAQAKRIARDTLDGKIWVPEVGTATHYHASYVHPWWVREMRKHDKIGVHIFYRPRKWEDDDVPVWASAARSTAEKSKSAAAPTGGTEKKL